MAEQKIADLNFWKERLDIAKEKNCIWQSVFHCHKELWDKIEEKHKSILRRVLSPEETVLDIGCGYGRLLDLLPPSNRDTYCGYDLSPDMIQEAIRLHPEDAFRFIVQDINRLQVPDMKYDWAIMSSIRPMVTNYLGSDAWKQMYWKIKPQAKKLLFLEYDPLDEGKVE